MGLVCFRFVIVLLIAIFFRLLSKLWVFLFFYFFYFFGFSDNFFGQTIKVVSFIFFFSFFEGFNEVENKFFTMESLLLECFFN